MFQCFKFRSLSLQTAVLVVTCATSTITHAAPVTLSVDSTLSSVTYNSSIVLFSTPYAATPDTANFAGNISADVDISSGGVISGFSLAGGDATATSTLTQEYILGFLGGTGFNVALLSFGFNTPGVPPSPNPAVVGGSFDLANHSVVFDDALLSPINGLLGGLLLIDDFPESPTTHFFLPTADFGGSGTITASPLGGADYLLTLTIPFSEQSSEDISAYASLNPGELIFDRNISGTIVATGIITVPEPSAGLLIAIASVALVIWRRFGA